MRWPGRVWRGPGGHSWRTVLAETAGTLACVGAVLWGWVAPSLLPRADPCVDRRTFAVAIGLQIVLLLGAITVTLVRAARLGASGGSVALLVGALLLPWAGATLYIWFATGVCWHLTM